MEPKEKLRIDKYLWAIRLFKTRSQAGDACSKGRVKVAGNSVKASRVVAIGDECDVKTENRRWVIKVTGLIEKRVQYSEAILNYEDLTPPEEKERIAYEAASFNTGKRQSKVGRPTKKQRRDIDDIGL